MRIDPREVTSPDDPRVATFTHLTDMDLRHRMEQDLGLFMAEGHLVIERCVQQGLTLQLVLTSARWLSRLEPLLATSDVTVYTADEALLREITGFRVHRGALATVQRPPEITPEDVLARPGDILVLEDLVDPTNVGLAVRSAIVQGITSAILSPACADPLYRRAVKASMGAVLRCHWARSRDWPSTLAQIAQQRELVALTPQGSDDLAAAMIDSRGRGVAILLGSEGPGLSDQALRNASRRAAIPMEQSGDSLNVAAATAVACFVRAQARTMRV